MNARPSDSASPSDSAAAAGGLDFRALIPRVPAPGVLWRPICFWIWVFFVVLILAAVPHFFIQFWFNQSLGYRTIFWTNCSAQALAFVAYGTAAAIAVALSLRLHAVSRGLRTAAIHVGAWAGILAGWWLALNYQQFLLAMYGVPFDVQDPVFGRDIGFYVYRLPAIQTVFTALEILLLFSLLCLLVGRYDELRTHGLLAAAGLRVRDRACLFAPPALLVLVCLTGATVTLQMFFRRYDLLFGRNDSSGVRFGAAYLDLVGVFSNLNSVYVACVSQASLTFVVALLLVRAHHHAKLLEGREDGEARPADSTLEPRFGGLLKTALALLLLPVGFTVGVWVKNFVFVAPNEPYVQLEYIQRHIKATREGYRLDRVQSREWVPGERPLTPSQLLASRTLANAPILPSWVSRLEEPPDVQHFERIHVSDSTLVYGPMLQIYQQHQQLRPYYDFLSVDGTRYTVDGQKRMFVSAVRELPSLALVGEKEWLKYWGSAALLYTHGMGLVMSPVNRTDSVGSPEYASSGIPPGVSDQELEHEPRIYFGEGAKDDYVLTNVHGLKEFDYATPQHRSEFVYPQTGTTGVHLNSLFRRAMFALYTKDITAFLFSKYIDPMQTRVHIRRTPMDRARSIAPFLFLDSNIHAFIADGRVLWLINGLTTTDRYPYSFRETLGDKADERAVEEFPERVVNYGEDSVKITIDAFSGRVHFYKIADDPIVNTWERIYPDLFEPAAEMPATVEAQLTYPLQWFHIQFDDIYKRYHQVDPIEFYNVEDLWDDADETIGSIGRGLSGFGTGDQMTFSYEGYNVLLDPADLPDGVDVDSPGDLQYTMLKPFTPEGARNLRALIMAFQDPGNYGKLVSLQIPQGSFVPGPEQVDAYIDNDRPVHQQVTMWIRHGSEVIRGGTLLLPVGGDIVYLETVWVNSLQNELPQLKLVAVRYQGRITSGASLEEAIRKRATVN